MGIVTKTFTECELDDNWIDKGPKGPSGTRKKFVAEQERATVTLRYAHGDNATEENISFRKGTPILLGESSVSYRHEETI